MTPNTKRFAWSNRDTAAHDLFQLVSYAPPSIRIRALRLLASIPSPTILPELEHIVLDETWDVPERRYALWAIAALPGDLYLPQFARFADPEHALFSAVMHLAHRHPRNIVWAFPTIDHLPPQIALENLVRMLSYSQSALNASVCQRMMSLVDQYPRLLDVTLIRTLYETGSSDVVRPWLSEKMPTLVYECLLSDMPHLFDLLEMWTELRETVFKNCASLKEDYDREKQNLASENQSAFWERNYQLSELWQTLCLIYTSALRDNAGSFHRLVFIATRETDDMSKRAIATYFLGKLKHKYDVQTPLLKALRDLSSDSRYWDKHLHTAAHFEACNALCEMPSAEVWEAMIDLFLTIPERWLDARLPRWIAYLTDYLSGIRTSLPLQAGWDSEEKRMRRYTYDDMNPANKMIDAK